MIYQAALTYGRQLLKADRLEEAIAYLDQAAYLKPLPADVEAEVQYARLYITARDYWNVNWEKAIESFGEFYKIGPGYRDTFARYVEAYIQYGDERTRAGDPCTAQTAIRRSTETAPGGWLADQGRGKSKQDCLTAPPSITGTNQTLAGLYAGRIAYPVFDANGARILAANAGDQKLYTAAIGDQPEWQRNGGKFAHRVGGSGANVIDNGNDVACRPGRRRISHLLARWFARDLLAARPVVSDECRRERIADRVGGRFRARLGTGRPAGLLRLRRRRLRHHDPQSR